MPVALSNRAALRKGFLVLIRSLATSEQQLAVLHRLTMIGPSACKSDHRMESAVARLTKFKLFPLVCFDVLAQEKHTALVATSETDADRIQMRKVPERSDPMAP